MLSMEPTRRQSMASGKRNATDKRKFEHMRARFEQQQEEAWEELLEEFAREHGLTDEEVQELDMDTL
jgi:hypothetical protein